ncbi:MAG: M20/M25/M40 family metallo-hydrolase, partial [Gemmatimonadetes bacterium]
MAGGLDGPLRHVRYLADDALEGREVGTRGERCAADYIAGAFAEAGLQPGGEEGGWFQTFPVRSGSELGTHNLLRAGSSLALGEDWMPFGFASTGRVEAALVYAGHAVAPADDPDHPFGGRDLQGRIVVVEDGDPGSPTGRSMAADPHFKARMAAERGAAALLVLLPDGAALPDPAAENRPAAGIPVAAVRGAAADRVRALAESGARAEVMVEVRPRRVEARNVVGVLPGHDPERMREVIVVGAHYDHLGWGGEGSLAPGAHAVHNGADDNASGTAALIEVARRLASLHAAPERTVVFVAFTGEERGLWGSGRFVRDPTIPLARAVAMINMDMVGRLRDGRLTVFGTGTAREWPELLERLAAERGLTLAMVPDGYGPSDHSSFYGAGIPVLHFFTNTHEDYHRPTDDWEKIDEEGLRTVAGLVGDVVGRLSYGEVTPTLIEGAGTPTAPADPTGEPEAPAEASRGYGPYFGSIPDMAAGDDVEGVRLTGVREGSPAAHAGLRAGDVIVSFGGKPVTDLYAYTYALREHAPGDRVQVVVLRDGER